MKQFKQNITKGLMCLLIGAAAFVATPVNAQEEGPNTGKVSFTSGFDITTAYWFRGMAQENQGFIIQPWLDMTVDIFECEDWSVAATVGTWNSVHSDSPSEDWYEADFYGGLSFGLPMGFSFDVSYINLYSPTNGTIFAEEFDFTLGYDDSAVWESAGLEGFALSPYVLIAVEIDGGSDAGVDEGVYLELGIEPSFEVLPSETMPITLSLPVNAGFSLDNYYESGPGGADSGFGFLDVGLVASTPLTFIPSDYGSWSLSAGVHMIYIEGSVQTIAGPAGFNVTGGEDVEVYGTVGISMEY